MYRRSFSILRIAVIAALAIVRAVDYGAALYATAKSWGGAFLGNMLGLGWGNDCKVKHAEPMPAAQAKLMTKWTLKRTRPQLSPHWRLCPSV